MMARTIVLVGGGSGGHLTPLVAVATALKKADKSTCIIYIGQKQEDLQKVMDSKFISGSYKISAGKFRRYHGESLISHILDFRTVFLNIRDLFRFIYGFIESWFLLGKIHPDAIFLKGGFVSVPVGFVARLRRIPYITHDSDAIPGLANSLTAKGARMNTTAQPISIYPYEREKTVQVGIPLHPKFKRVTKSDMVASKKALGVSSHTPILFVVGGGLGARRINMALVKASKKILKDIPNLIIIHITGKKLFDETLHSYKETLEKIDLKRVRLVDFSTELYKLSSAADVVVTRAGATNIAEFATQAKPCIVIPNPVLTGGQQLHNANVLRKSKAALILYETELDSLDEAVLKVLSDKQYAQSIANALNELAPHESARKIANILLDIAQDKQIGH